MRSRGRPLRIIEVQLHLLGRHRGLQHHRQVGRSSAPARRASGGLAQQPVIEKLEAVLLLAGTLPLGHHRVILLEGHLLPLQPAAVERPRLPVQVAPLEGHAALWHAMPPRAPALRGEEPRQTPGPVEDQQRATLLVAPKVLAEGRQDLLGPRLGALLGQPGPPLRKRLGRVRARRSRRRSIKPTLLGLNNALLPRQRDGILVSLPAAHKGHLSAQQRPPQRLHPLRPSDLQPPPGRRLAASTTRLRCQAHRRRRRGAGPTGGGVPAEGAAPGTGNRDPSSEGGRSGCSNAGTPPEWSSAGANCAIAVRSRRGGNTPATQEPRLSPRTTPPDVTGSKGWALPLWRSRGQSNSCWHPQSQAVAPQHLSGSSSAGFGAGGQ
mmetsp:Transcript_28711/g.95341  ORF Transcript_28711/g.95341 Transcript_28711/m.95341 type:complete len:379 (-) Transcript_28711:40-1176(-)